MMFGKLYWEKVALRAQSIEDLRQAASRYLPRVMFDFYDGGAEDECTLRGNREAFTRLRLRPRVLVNVEKVSTTQLIFGAPAGMPVAIAPTGGGGYGRRTTDVALAKAAAHFGLPYTLSTSATASIERIAREAPGRHWFQAYILKDRELLNRLIDRARDADYEALMITVDLPVGGKRERDLRNGFRTPFRMGWKIALDGMRHPRWTLGVALRGFPSPENLLELDRSMNTVNGAMTSVGKSYDPSFDWDRLKEIRDKWPRRLIVKGVVRGDDAAELVKMGCDAIVVSNHGGRQLDGGIATMDALPDVLGGVAGRIPVFVDGGVRRGVDVLKACAAGASGVLVGRATLYGALAAGEPGAMRSLSILKDELDRSMRLCGMRDLSTVNGDLLATVSEHFGAGGHRARSLDSAVNFT
ncbi:alpha-hydroxy acid oxidase [Ottowia thiooxydans]|uniref:alpha-hydroxy acid oxidase n=1 Tax=Ottowia thiooxydans TaxID=219182 RepID=UPI0004150A38|nr:alpha-hydroxy acid oxidase [Ottowia thiooxydans]